MPETTEVPPAAPTASPGSLWQACLHESAHLIGASVLLKRAARAMVFGDGSGVAAVGGGVPASFKEAMVAAAGICGDMLGLLYTPPKGVSATPADVADPDTSQRVHAAMGAIMSDRVALARWAILDHESKPLTWVARHEWVLSSAQEFVLEHRHEILETATDLFTRGIVNLPAEPAGKDQDHVD